MKNDSTFDLFLEATKRSELLRLPTRLQLQSYELLRNSTIDNANKTFLFSIERIYLPLTTHFDLIRHSGARTLLKTKSSNYFSITQAYLLHVALRG